MKFDELDTEMRVFETAHDQAVLPGLRIVARLDGRNFTRLTKELMTFERPFDEGFRDHMLETAEHLMACGFRVVYGCVQSDEISLLFDDQEEAFGRRIGKFTSVLAGEASAKFSLLLGHQACFDCRISQLPDDKRVVDYFRWRNEDAHRNALNGYCYWTLRNDGRSGAQAAKDLLGLSVADKNELLFRHGINFNDLPLWQKRGVGLCWEVYDKPGRNPNTGAERAAARRRIRRIFDLPMKQAYSDFIVDVIERARANPAAEA